MAKLWDDTRTYNAIGRSTAKASSNPGDNFFTKKLRSAENAIGTTLATPAAFVHNMETDRHTAKTLEDHAKERDKLYQKYGFQSYKDYDDQLFNSFNEDGTQTDETVRLLNIPGLTDEANALEAQFNKENTNRAAELRDYAENNYVSKKIGQDRGKFAGSAINTLSTGFDVLSMAAGIPNGALMNAGQGAIEGIADELEQNGFENFDWKRAGQNATVGAASGLATGALNAKLGTRMANNGGNIINGRNFITKGANSILKSGVGRGALSGAVGGAVGGATGSALAGQDIGTGINNALAGAVQGAKQGAIAGGTMSLANRAFNRFAPNAAQAMQENAARNASYGDTLKDQFKGAWNSGDSATAEFLKTVPDRVNNLADSINNSRLRNIGGTLQDVSGLEQDNLAKATAISQNNTELQSLISDIADRAQQFKSQYNKDGTRPWSKDLYDYDNIDSRVLDTLGISSDLDGSYAAAVTRVLRERGLIGNNGQASTTLGAGPSIKDANGTQEAGPIPEDIQNMRMNNNTESPETEVYRTVMGETEQPRIEEPNLMYGESELGNRTRRGMVADSLERFGNTLEGAQANVTRAAEKDLGIESSGRVIENVRKKTGLTNLETQAAFAKELTGGENSLMDNVQRMALTASDDGKGYRVDTTDIAKRVDTIVDDEIPISLFGSQSARDKFIANLKRDVTSYDGDIISNSNKLKAVASDLRGKGVVDPPALDKAKAKVYTKIAKEMDNLSYSAIPQDNVDAMFDATINEMRGRASQAQANGNKDVASAYNRTADNLDAQPRTIPAYRAFKKDFVDVSKINTLSQRAENGAAMQMGRGFGSGVKRFTGTLLQRPVNAGLAKIGGAINNVADNLGERSVTTTPTIDTPTTTTTAETPYNPSTQLYNAIGRTEGETQGEKAARGYIERAVKTSSPVVISNTPSGASTALYNTVGGTGTTTSAGNTATGNTLASMTSGDYYTDLIGRAMMAAAKDNDVAAFGPLFEMYLEALSAQKKNSSSETKLTDKQRQANAAERALEDMENAENNFAYDISDIPIIGDVANLRGNDYKNKAEALALQVGYMLSGATVNREEAKNIGMAYVPQPRESEAERKRKLTQLRGIISDYQKTYEG